MAKLKDLVNININRDFITVQGAEIPVIFTMESFPYIEEAYGKGYQAFERDLNALLQKGSGATIGELELKIVRSLIYGMVHAGGTECTPDELRNAIPISEISGIFEKVLEIFTNQIFQASDQQKLQGAAAKSKKKRK